MAEALTQALRRTVSKDTTIFGRFSYRQGKTRAEKLLELHEGSYKKIVERLERNWQWQGNDRSSTSESFRESSDHDLFMRDAPRAYKFIDVKLKGALTLPGRVTSIFESRNYFH